MGMPEQVENPKVVAIIDEICRKVKDKGLLLGTASGSSFEKWKQRGIDWIAPVGDCDLLSGAGRKLMEETK